MLPPSIVEQPALTMVGVEASFIHALSPDSTNCQVIPSLWNKLHELSPQIPNRSGDAMIGLIYGRPKVERTHPDELQYIAGVPVVSSDGIPAGMVSRTIPAGTFAVFIHRGPIQGIVKSVNFIYRTWLPQSAYRHAEIADIEVYDRRFCGDRDDSEMEYWISVTPKTMVE